MGLSENILVFAGSARRKTCVLKPRQCFCCIGYVFKREMEGSHGAGGKEIIQKGQAFLEKESYFLTP